MSGSATPDRAVDPDKPCDVCGLPQPCKCTVDWNQPDATPGATVYCSDECFLYALSRVTMGVTDTTEQEATLPTGTPKTDAEKRADVLLSAIEQNAKELHQLVYAGQADARKIEKVRAELNGFSGAGVSAHVPAPVKDGK